MKGYGMAAASMAVAAFVTAKGGDEQDCVAVWSHLWGTGAIFPTHPAEALQDLQNAWNATREQQ